MDVNATHPTQGTHAQRAAASASLQDRMANAMSRVAADPKQSKRVRAANARDAKTAREMASRMRAAS